MQGVRVMGWGTPQPHGAVDTQQGGDGIPALLRGEGDPHPGESPEEEEEEGRVPDQAGIVLLHTHEVLAPLSLGCQDPAFLWGAGPVLCLPLRIWGGEGPPCPSFWQLLPPPKPCLLFRCPQAGASWPPLQDPL